MFVRTLAIAILPSVFCFYGLHGISELLTDRTCFTKLACFSNRNLQGRSLKQVKCVASGLKSTLQSDEEPILEPENCESSLLKIARRLNRFDVSDYMPFRIGNQAVGWVNETLARQILEVQNELKVRTFVFEWPQCRVGPDGRAGGFDAGLIGLNSDLLQPSVTLQARSHAVAAVLEEMFRRGLMRGWRGEMQAVGTGYGPLATPLLLVERGAVPYLGVSSYGCHVNVYSRRGGEKEVWVARRALDKPTYPGLLDQCVAGGLPSGLSVRDNVAKECQEEAGFPPALAAQAVPVGAVRYCYSTRKGLSPKTLFVFDLEVPEGTAPVNADGEVESFARLPLSQALLDLRQDPAGWKPNSALVLADFAARHGALDPDAEPGYLELLHLLRGSAGLPAEA